jgi:very-short-patch-repair endonuclease
MSNKNFGESWEGKIERIRENLIGGKYAPSDGIFPIVKELVQNAEDAGAQRLVFALNKGFYDNDLVVFPSATIGGNNLGIRYHQIENGKFTDRGNIIEAAAVAEAIVDHARRHPDESLGVGTFNLNQRVLIEDCLEKICQDDSSAREAVSKLNEQSEKLFVKNLENLQGDERDVIFISYTYGPDADSGRVMNRFGPITGDFGWRRLNVLITRARKRIHVFSSMSPGDILGGPGKSKGVNAMKDYLEFAQTGKLPDRGIFSGRDADSPFESAVARVVMTMGLKVVPQVGVAGYFIDIGVLRPENQQEFLLGIECDGATYHSVKSARDRDRLREEVIRSRGWQLHRIWSTDWFLNQRHEEKRLQSAIQAAMGR